MKIRNKRELLKQLETIKDFRTDRHKIEYVLIVESFFAPPTLFITIALPSCIILILSMCFVSTLTTIEAQDSS